MEPTASRIAILPRRHSTTGAAERRAAAMRETTSGCSIHWLRRDDDPGSRARSKRIAILDPFGIERRLLVALAEAQGHRVVVHHDVDDLLAGWRDAQIAFVHICFDQAMRRAAEAAPLPPVVLIDSRGIAADGRGQAARIGDFAAIRFPIGLREFAEAVGRNAL
jgi:hypothetical protein